MIEKIHGLKTERLIRRIFEAIKFHNIQGKFEMARDELEVKIPEREELEQKKEKLTKAAATQTKKHLMRQAYYRLCDQKYKAFLIWKDYCNYWRNVMGRLKLRLISEHKRRTLWAFIRMKEGTDKVVHMELMEMVEDQVNQN